MGPLIFACIQSEASHTAISDDGRRCGQIGCRTVVPALRRSLAPQGGARWRRSHGAGRPLGHRRHRGILMSNMGVSTTHFKETACIGTIGTSSVMDAKILVAAAASIVRAGGQPSAERDAQLLESCISFSRSGSHASASGHGSRRSAPGHGHFPPCVGGKSVGHLFICQSGKEIA